MADMADQIVTRLVAAQGERTDAEFAALLGISRTHWSHIRAGRRFITRELQRRAVQAFPEIWPTVLGDLAGLAPEEAAS